MQQSYLPNYRPTSYSAEDLFEFCVKRAIEKKLLSETNTHNQWAGKLFSYERNSILREDYMSKVKQEYSIYFAKNLKYSFDEEKIKRDFPKFFGIMTSNHIGEYTSEYFVHKNIEALNKEIQEQKNPDNIESFKGVELTLLRKQETSYIYQVKLDISDGQEPHFHDGTPFILKILPETIPCEAVDFDYESGKLFFTTNRFIHPISFCSILLDATFIIEGLKKKLQRICEEGVNEDLPFSKFIFEETEELIDVQHPKVADNLKQALDESQRKAFDAAVNKDITFIWGPPGTGKSFTLASIIYALYTFEKERTIICCLSNVAVDQLLSKVLDIIEREGIDIAPGNIYRAGRTMDNRIIATDYLFPNDKETEELRKEINNNTTKIQRFKDKKLEMSKEAIILKATNKDLREKLKVRTESLIDKSRVVFSTISNFVLSNKLNTRPFENLIVDEASMLAMPSLIALGSNITKRLIMVGDFQQLSPITIVKDPLLTDSVFKTTGIDIKNTTHPGLHQLLNQRRSNKEIVDLINHLFYDDKLMAKIEGKNDIIHSQPFKDKIIALKVITNGAVRFTKGGTRQNILFAKGVIELLDKFYEDTHANYTIGIITPYKGQVALIKALHFERRYPEEFSKRLRIGTIHTFQGSECDVIIYDMVDCGILENGRTSQIGKIYGGRDGERLLNVAVSRAKHKLIVVCDPTYISNISGNTLTPKTRQVFNLLSKKRF